MSFSRFGMRPLLVASFGLASLLAVSPRVFAQDAPVNAPAVVADEEPVVPSTPFPSLIALDPGDTVWTLKVHNGVLKVNGDVAVNSTNKGAIWMSGGFIDAQKGHVNVVGGVSRLGKNPIRPLESIGANAVSDPLPEFMVPSPGKVISAEKLFLGTDEDDQVLPPGIYNGGIFASGKGHITLQPGVFIIANGDFSAIGPTVEGEGVTIVMAGNTPGAFSVTLGAKFNASAPTSGKLKDLLLISRASGALAKGIWIASAEANMKGIIYAPNASVDTQYSKNVKVGKIIAKSVSITSGNMEVTGLSDAKAPAEDAVATELPVAP